MIIFFLKKLFKRIKILLTKFLYEIKYSHHLILVIFILYNTKVKWCTNLICVEGASIRALHLYTFENEKNVITMKTTNFSPPSTNAPQTLALTLTTQTGASASEATSDA